MWRSKWWGPDRWGCATYCIYFEGNGPRDPLFLQMKEEAASVYSAYLPDAHPAHHNGQRTVQGQRAMQVQSDPFLGWTHMEGRDYLVRQLNDHKGSIELEDLKGTGLNAFAEICGELLARGHARSGDPKVIAGYIGTGDRFAGSVANSARCMRTRRRRIGRRCEGIAGQFVVPSSEFLVQSS